MEAKKRIVAGVVGVHLLLAALYAPHVPVEPVMPAGIGRAIALYGSFSGVGTHFDFFAPSVGTQARVRFSATSADGSTRELALRTTSAEANNRIAMMLTYHAYPEVRQELLRALGGYMLRLNPGAVTVESRVELLEIPALESASRGAPSARWVTLDRATVRRDHAPRP